MWYNFISSQMWCLELFIKCLCYLNQESNLLCRLQGDSSSAPLGTVEAGRVFGGAVGPMEQLRVLE